jgi:acyl-CoA reductase-like NAD-dependent aldehyde dehydrogenase
VSQPGSSSAGLFIDGRWTRASGEAIAVMDVMREEIFGPVMPIASVSTLDQAFTLANATRYHNFAAAVSV